MHRSIEASQKQETRAGLGGLVDFPVLLEFAERELGFISSPVVWFHKYWADHSFSAYPPCASEVEVRIRPPGLSVKNPKHL